MSKLLERLWYDDSRSVPLTLARAPLWMASLGFGAGVSVRNALYDRGLFAGHRIEGARIISVGNLNVGGAGKTQVAIFLLQELVSRGLRAAVLSRGYGRRSTQPVSFSRSDGDLPPASETGDEPLLIAHRCPHVRVHVGADRVALARRAVAEGAQVLVLDDGMQHRRLARDEDLVVLDEAVGLGNGAMLPAGPLREPVSSLRRASVLWLRASERAKERAREEESPVRRLLPTTLPVIRARHAPSDVLLPDGTLAHPDILKGHRVHLLSALARPGSFRRTAESLGAEVIGETVRPDHHPWREDELQLALTAARRENSLLLTTEKDRVKLPPNAEVHTVRLGVELLSGREHLERLLAGEPTSG